MGKKKKLKVDKRERITEYSGWKSGDVCQVVLSGDSSPSMCEIIEFYPEDSIVPAVSLMQTKTGMSRVAAFESIAETVKEAKLLSAKWKKKYEKIKKKQEKLLRDKIKNRKNSEETKESDES